MLRLEQCVGGDLQNGLRNYLQTVRQNTDFRISRDLRYVRVSNILLRLYIKVRSGNVDDVDAHTHNCIHVNNRNDNTDNRFTISNSFSDLAFWVQTLREQFGNDDQYIWPHISNVRPVIDTIAREFYNPNGLVPPVGSVVVFPLGLTMYNSTNRQWVGGHANFIVFKKTTRRKWRWFIIEPHTPDRTRRGFYQAVWMNMNYLFNQVNNSLGGVNTLFPYGNLSDFNIAPNILLENPRNVYTYQHDDLNSLYPRPNNVGRGIQGFYDLQVHGGYCIYFSTYILLIYLFNHTKISIQDATSFMFKQLPAMRCPRPGNVLNQGVACVLNIGYILMSARPHNFMDYRYVILRKKHDDAFNVLEERDVMEDRNAQRFAARNNAAQAIAPPALAPPATIAQFNNNAMQSHERYMDTGED